MSDYQRRWLCKECKREWVEPTYHFVNSAPVSITGNPKGDNCPVCGSPEIAEIAFKPFMPGLDIPRDGEYLELPKAEKVATIPGQTGNLDFKITKDTPKEFKIKQDTPLALVSSRETKIQEEEQLAAVADTIESNRNPSIYDLADMD